MVCESGQPTRRSVPDPGSGEAGLPTPASPAADPQRIGVSQKDRARHDASHPSIPPPENGGAVSSEPARGMDSTGLLAVFLLNAIGEGVGIATRQGVVLWANDLFRRQRITVAYEIAHHQIHDNK